MSLKQDLTKTNPSIGAVAAIVGTSKPIEEATMSSKETLLTEDTEIRVDQEKENVVQTNSVGLTLNLVGKSKERRIVHKNFTVTPTNAKKFKDLAESYGLSENELFNQICDKL